MADVFSELFFDEKLPVANCDDIRKFVSDNFGFDKSKINVIRSVKGQVCYPLFESRDKNYIVFRVKDYIYQCLNGSLKLIGEEG